MVGRRLERTSASLIRLRAAAWSNIRREHGKMTGRRCLAALVIIENQPIGTGLLREKNRFAFPGVHPLADSSPSTSADDAIRHKSSRV